MPQNLNELKSHPSFGPFGHFPVVPGLEASVEVEARELGPLAHARGKVLQPHRHAAARDERCPEEPQEHAFQEGRHEGGRGRASRTAPDAAPQPRRAHPHHLHARRQLVADVVGQLARAYLLMAFLGVDMPRRIKDHAFACCWALTRLNFSEGLKVIGQAAFNDAGFMHSLILPSTVTQIDEEAFNNNHFDDVYIHAYTEPSVNKYGAVFRLNTVGNIDKLHVPNRHQYSAATWLNWFDEIVNFDPIEEVVIDEFTWPDAGDHGDYSVVTVSPGCYIKDIYYARWVVVDLTTNTFQKNTNYTVMIEVKPCQGYTLPEVAYILKSDGTRYPSDYASAVSNSNNKIYQFNIFVGERQNDKLIPSIDFEWPEPVVGHDPAADMVLYPYEDTTEGCTLSGIVWTVVDENRQMEEGETFQEGKVYQLMGVLTADDGYAFSDYTGCTLNGHYPDAFGKFITKDYFAFYHYYVPTNSQPTPITTVEAEPVGSDAWFSLDGRRLPSAPTRNGIYLHKGQKVVIRSDK